MEIKKILIIHSYGRTASQLAYFCQHSFMEIEREADVFNFNPYRYSSHFFGAFAKIEYKINVKKLFSKIESFSPNCILVIKGDELKRETLLAIKKRYRIPIINWWIDDPGLINISKKISNAYDIFFTNDPDSIQIHLKNGASNVKFLSFGCFPKIHRSLNMNPNEINKYESDIVFVGRLNPKRVDILLKLTDFNLKIWSEKVFFIYDEDRNLIKKIKIHKKNPLYKIIIREVWGDELVKVYNSAKIIINIHSHGTSDPNMRVFEATACGAFLITEHRKHLSDFFDINTEIETFKNITELREKISFYLKHNDKRIKMAKAAQKKAHSIHTYKDRMNSLIKEVELLQKI